jgi:hypothetical protein
MFFYATVKLCKCSGNIAATLYIPTIDRPILLQEICKQILGMYKSLADTHESGNWD